LLAFECAHRQIERGRSENVYKHVSVLLLLPYIHLLNAYPCVMMMMIMLMKEFGAALRGWWM
jgi:hypothetical protein